MLIETATEALEPTIHFLKRLRPQGIDAALGIGGLVVTTVAPVVSFIAFGAKEAVGQIEQAVEQVQHSIADARDHAVAPPPPSAEEGPKAIGAGPEFLPH